MVDTTLSGLPASGAVADTDIFYGVQAGSVKTTAAQLKTFSSLNATLTGNIAGGTGVIGGNLVNPADSDVWWKLRSGATGDFRNYFAWQDYLDNNRWLMGRNASNDFILYDAGIAHRFQANTNGATYVSSAGANAVIINGHTDGASGTAGLQVRSGGGGGTTWFTVNAGIVKAGSTGSLGFDNGAGTADVLLHRDAANTLAHRNGTAAQLTRIYNTYTDVSNFERANLSWISNTFTISTEASGTGTNRGMRFSAINGITFNTNSTDRWIINGSGHWNPAANNSYDFGATGSRPRDIWVGRDLYTAGGTQSVLRSASAITSGAGAQTGTLSNAPLAGNPTCWIPINDNGTTRYIPAW